MDGRGARSDAKPFQRSRESWSGFGHFESFGHQKCVPLSRHSQREVD